MKKAIILAALLLTTAMPVYAGVGEGGSLSEASQAKASAARAEAREHDDDRQERRERGGWASGKTPDEIASMRARVANPRTRDAALRELREHATTKKARLEVKKMGILAKMPGVRVDQLQDACQSCWGSTGANKYRGDPKGWGGKSTTQKNTGKGDNDAAINK